MNTRTKRYLASLSLWLATVQCSPMTPYVMQRYSRRYRAYSRLNDDFKLASRLA